MENKPCIAVSSCLLGQPCRYDGKSKPHEAVIRLSERFDVCPLCPEQLGGLPTPRTPSEIIEDASGTRAISCDGEDRTEAFFAGAYAALEAAQKQECAYAVLKAKSPSCGVESVYDGTFSGTLRAGSGITARVFQENGIFVFDENHLQELLSAFESGND